MCGSLFSGEAAGVAGVDGVDVLEGVCISGIFKCGSIFSGEALGGAGVDGVDVLEGVCIPGMFICGSIFSREVDGVERSRTAGMFTCRTLLISRFLTGRFLRIIGLLRRSVAFLFSFGLGLLMPGIL